MRKTMLLALLACAFFVSACSTDSQYGVEASAQTAMTAASVYRSADVCVDGEDQTICAKISVVKKIHAAEVSLYTALLTYRAAVEAGDGVSAAKEAVVTALENLNTILDLEEVQAVINGEDS